MTALDDIVGRFRKQSPNIAAAFDEVQRVADADRARAAAGGVVVPPAAVPPPFGANLFVGFEWAQQAVTGTVAYPTTNAELVAAIASGSDIIDGGGRTFTPGEVRLPAHSAFRELRNAKLIGSRVLKSNTSNWRLRGCDLSLATATQEDNLKGDAGGFIDVDGCNIHHAPGQGILLNHGDVVIRNSHVHHNGNTTNKDHGLYAKEGRRLLTFNTAWYANHAYQIQVYPSFHGFLAVCCTLFGGVTRGGIVVGSENVDSTSEVRLVGCIIAGSATLAVTKWQSASNITIEDCLGWANAQGDVDPALLSSTSRWRHADPLFVDPDAGDFRLRAGSPAKGMIDVSLHGLVPATDIGGRARVTADAGCHTTS